MTDDHNKPVTSFDVARRAGVSRSMVSRAFTEGANISEKSREKVLKAAEELGYRVNFLARGLQTRQSNLVGIVASSLDTPFRSRQVRIAAQEFISHGYRPILLTVEPGDDVGQWVSVMLNYNVAGVMVTSATPSPKIIQECRKLRMPLVLINRGKNQDIADTVQIDVQQAGELAFTMLTRSRAGRLAVVHPQIPSYSVTGRARAFIEKCRIENIEVDEFISTSQSYAAGYDIAGNIGLSLDHIDGVFCATDLLALGVMDRLRADWNTRFPDDLQVVGCDDIEQAGWGAYHLSTIRQDAEEQVLAAVTQMLERIENPDAPIQHYNQRLTPIFRKTTLSNYD
ncbi:LacI family DNA-binding transcriptional regulator [Rhodobacteraceae bacterium B1Z28]|uniref:LacI family DNA-binding transcriptional regulator n=1 Tax=Ruegeria haliotis TaxID=2747601 RepID=A0ABX2PM96_9RHOB|nr:LacI family DNA-binding transcriptional regulator [Ruegeria haliotis]NVO55242.1 LacI family DNA-binding transcriptional regulator [Ruegeria haliotis]